MPWRTIVSSTRPFSTRIAMMVHTGKVKGLFARDGVKKYTHSSFSPDSKS